MEKFEEYIASVLDTLNFNQLMGLHMNPYLQYFIGFPLS